MSKITRVGQGIYSAVLTDDMFSDEFVVDFNRWEYDYRFKGETIMVRDDPSRYEGHSLIRRLGPRKYQFKHFPDEPTWSTWNGDGIECRQIEKIYELYQFDLALEKALND